jgi:hypothetical protein
LIPFNLICPDFYRTNRQKSGRNYLKGTAGDQINTLLAAAAYNISCCSIQYEEVDEIEKTRNIILYFSLVLPDHSFGPGKYPKLEKNQKTQ